MYNYKQAIKHTAMSFITAISLFGCGSSGMVGNILDGYVVADAISGSNLNNGNGSLDNNYTYATNDYGNPIGYVVSIDQPSGMLYYSGGSMSILSSSYNQSLGQTYLCKII